MKNHDKKRKNKRAEIKAAIESLFQEKPEYDTQQQIIDDLKAMKIEATQATVSRALSDLGIEPNETGKWTKSENDEKLKQLEKTFEICGGNFRLPRLYHRGVDVLILRTMPDFNTVIAKQIREAFPKEVLCTFCPDDKNVIIYYKLREKEADDDESQNSEEKSQTTYKKSHLRVELVKLCKKYRKSKPSEKKCRKQ